MGYRYREEDFIQISYLNWFKTNYPELKGDIHHFANERKCSVYEGVRLKRMGVLPGVYDVHIAIPRLDLGYAGFWMELKTKKGRLSDHQIAFGNRKTQRGYKTVVVWSLEEAKKETLNYLEGFNYGAKL